MKMTILKAYVCIYTVIVTFLIALTKYLLRRNLREWGFIACNFINALLKIIMYTFEYIYKNNHIYLHMYIQIYVSIRKWMCLYIYIYNYNYKLNIYVSDDTCICIYFCVNNVVSLHNMHVLVIIQVDVTKYPTKTIWKKWFILAYSSK